VDRTRDDQPGDDRGEDLNRPRRRRTTLADIAARAGVSVASVSFALNGAPGVSNELRERIVGLADELGFRPNRAARDLQAGTSSTIGLVLVDLSNPFYPEIASGVIAAATARGHEVLISQVGTDERGHRDAVLAQLDRGSEGMLLTSITAGDAPLLKELQRRGHPFVQVYREIDDVQADFVGIDDFGAGTEMGTHVAACGYRRVAVLGGAEDSSASRRRALGFVAGLESGGATVINRDNLWGELTRASGAERSAAILDGHPDIEAFVCGNDVIAVGVYDTCRSSGLAVPGDVGLTGFDDMSLSSAGPFQLTTMTVPRDDMGRISTDLLLDRIAGDTSPPRRVVLAHSLQVRETTSERAS
jgi:LacI family transcriptional regulator